MFMVVNNKQNDSDVHLAPVESAYNDSVSTAIGLAPNKVLSAVFLVFPSLSLGVLLSVAIRALIAIIRHSTILYASITLSPFLASNATILC